MTDKNPNPQGKGLTPVLDSLVSSRTRLNVPPKRIEQVATELFTSLFVLESSFRFKPVVAKPYWLYRKSGEFRLSPIAPHEWSEQSAGQAIAECILQADLTWTLTLSDAAAGDNELLAEIEARRQQFEARLEQAEKVDDLLPVFEQKLPFYQRVFASALANSLKVSMQKSGTLGLNYDEARGLLAHDGESPA